MSIVSFNGASFTVTLDTNAPAKSATPLPKVGAKMRCAKKASHGSGYFEPGDELTVVAVRGDPDSKWMQRHCGVEYNWETNQYEFILSNGKGKSQGFFVDAIDEGALVYAAPPEPPEVIDVGGRVAASIEWKPVR